VQYPDVHCTKDGSICQLTTAEGEINAANSAMALILSPLFDLIKTYFFLGGISGISPKVGTLGAVAFASWAVQVGMQYEIDAREKPNNFSTGYIPLGSTDPSEYPQYIYGTEAHVINDELRQLVILFAQNATLNDTTSAQAYRQLYANQSDFTPALSKPSVIACDTATSDVWWSGSLIGSAFENTTKLFTNGSATMCTSAQEDNAVLGALMRGAVAHLVDFSRVIVMRTASDFDRPPANMTVVDNLTNGQGAGYDAAVLNIYLAGIKVVQGIVEGWNTTFEAGIQPKNYIGDIFGSLGGTPNFGPGSLFNGKAAPVPPPAPRMTPSSSALRSLR
jgi:purine nucleoside permease